MHKEVLVVFTYLITRDIVETLQRKFGFSLTKEAIQKIRDLEKGFLSIFWPAIPEGISKTVVAAGYLSKQLDLVIPKNGVPLVSLDRVYITDADKYLEVTRLTNQKTGEVSITARPGNKSLKEQIKDLGIYSRIKLVDIGAFEGETLLKICETLEKEGTEIEEIYLGCSSNEANKKINGIRKLTVLNLFDFYEWVELRDLFGIDGRNVGTINGTRLYMPYWENLSKWASIPEKAEPTIKRLCQDNYQQLTEILRDEGCNIERMGKIVNYGG